MKYQNGTTVINIPDKEIKHLQDVLSLSYNEAVYTWLCDNDYEVDPTETELTKTAKKNRITATIHQAKAENPPKKGKRTRKAPENPEKEEIITQLATFLNEIVENVSITNKTKIIEFTIGENNYKLDLIQRRKPKK